MLEFCVGSTILPKGQWVFKEEHVMSEKWFRVDFIVPTRGHDATTMSCFLPFRVV